MTRQNGDTRATTAALKVPAVGHLLAPGLTILAHPDPERVGERAMLTPLYSGRPMMLSRLEPGFVATPSSDRPRSVRSLADLHLSRRPIRLLPGPRSGSLVVDPTGCPCGVRIDGSAVREPRRISREEVGRGVVVTLSRRVVLLLSPLLPLTPDQAVPTAEAAKKASQVGTALVGESLNMVRLRREIAQAADLSVPVLLRGETGTGKDLVARAIHDAGPRRDRAFIAVNMGAVPETLAAAELFGAERGAFTGAERSRKGFFEHAHTGTLFLDEIGETPPGEQALLLRALESGEIQPVGPVQPGGSVERRRVDVRVITATDADLEEAVTEGCFRAALLHRLEGFQIHLPPLRDRRDDIGRLLQHFLHKEAGERARDIFNPPGWVVERLALHLWPGNVRELQNVARRLVLMGKVPEGNIEADLHRLLDELLGSEALESRVLEFTAAPGRRRNRKGSEISDGELLAALRGCRWRPGPAARKLGVSRSTLYRLLETRSEFRKAGDLTQEEIEAALTRHDGDVDAAAQELQVSPHGLKIRRRKSRRGQV